MSPDPGDVDPAEQERALELRRRYYRTYWERHHNDPAWLANRAHRQRAYMARLRDDADRLARLRERERHRDRRDPATRELRRRASRRYYVRRALERPAVLALAEQVARGERVARPEDLPDVLHPGRLQTDHLVAPSEDAPDPGTLALHRWRGLVRRWALLVGVSVRQLQDAGLWPDRPPGEPLDAWTGVGRTIRDEPSRPATNHRPVEPVSPPLPPLPTRSALVAAARGVPLLRAGSVRTESMLGRGA